MNHLIGKTVQFTAMIEYMEAYPEAGMRAVITDAYCEDANSKDVNQHIYAIEFDFTNYDEFNRQFETANYYDSKHEPNLTAREAGYYKTKEKIFFGSPEIVPFKQYFTVLDEKTNRLYRQFKETGLQNYVEWLEGMVE